MTALPESFLTPEEYLEIERAAETRSEYHDGIMVAMSGSTAPHSRRGLRMGGMLDAAVRERGGIIFNTDMKVWILKENLFLYPDVSGLCEPPEYHDEETDALINPRFVVEVLSRTTEVYDRGTKLGCYMTLPSIVEIVLVSQRALQVEKYTRQRAGAWRFEMLRGCDATLRFESLGCELLLGDLYNGIDLDPEITPGMR